MRAEDLELLEYAQPERRLRPRPEPPPPSLAPRMRRFVDWVVDRIESGWAGWTVYVVTCSACVAFMAWTLSTRLDRFDEAYALMGQRAGLEREFEALAEHYSTDELRRLLERISSAESTVFSSYTDLAAWLAGQSEAARRRQLVLGYVMLEPVAARIRNVTEVPLALSVRPEAGQEPGAYGRMLGFLRDMVGQRWHLEITDTAVAGDGSNLVSLDTTVHVWISSGLQHATGSAR